MMNILKTTMLALGAMVALAGSAQAGSYFQPYARSQCVCAPGACAAGQCSPNCAHCAAGCHHGACASPQAMHVRPMPVPQVHAYQPARPVQHWTTAARPVFSCGTPIAHGVPRFAR